MSEACRTPEELLAELGELRLSASRLEEAWQAMRESESRYRRLLETITDYVYTVMVENGAAVSTSHGEGCFGLTGYTAGEYADNPLLWFQMVHEQDRQAVLEQARRLLRGEDAPALEHRILHKDGSVRWVRNTPVVHRDALGRVNFYDGIIQDITKAKAMEEKASHASLHDPLTGLPNRLLLMDRLERMIEDARRRSGQLAVLFVDLDYFKPINDRYGHAVGDEVLREAAGRILTQLRASDTVARVGGDEFVVLLGEQRKTAGAAAVAKKIISAFKKPYQSLKGGPGPGGSVGISLFPGDGDTPAELLEKADQAMYLAKNSKRGSFAFFSPPPAARTGPSPD